MYHGFTDKKVHNGIENYLGYHINIEIFRAQIEYLKKYYNIISLEQLIDYYHKNSKIPDNSVVITIDDGYKSNYTLAYSVLKEFGIPATIFLTTSFTDNKNFLWFDRTEYSINTTKQNKLEVRIKDDKLFFNLNSYNEKLECVRKIKSKLKLLPRDLIGRVVVAMERYLDKKLATSPNIPEIYFPLEWSEAKEMVKSGLISIGSHTHTHSILTKCSYGEIKEELILSKQLIEKKIGKSCFLFCYPNGQVGDFDHRTKKLLQESGYLCGLTTVTGMNNNRSDVFALKRFYTSSSEDLVEFIMILSGISGFFNNLRKLISK